MKLSKYAKLVKASGYCCVVNVAGSGMWLGTRHAVYKATELPCMRGETQVRTVLDIAENAWKKIYLEEMDEAPCDIMGLNLNEYVVGEQDTEKVDMMVQWKGQQVECLRCKGDKELLFFDPALLRPLDDEMKNDGYIAYTVRTKRNGQKYIVVHDGLYILAAIMPVKVIGEKFLAALADFQASCAEQFYSEQSRRQSKSIANENEAEQIGMDESGEER